MIRIDTRIIPRDHKGEPFTVGAIEAPTLWARLKQLVQRDGVTDAVKAIDKIEGEIKAMFGDKAEDLMRPMDLADCFIRVVELSKEYSGEHPGPKKTRAKLLRLLYEGREGELEIADEHVAILEEDLKGPRVHADLMLFLDEYVIAAKAAAVEEDKRKREETAKGASSVAIVPQEGATG